MEKLLKSTTAYRIFAADAKNNALSHAYLLYFSDRYNLREALKLFALQLFGADADSRDGKLILKENFADMRVYPQADKKLSVADAGEIVADSALRPVERDKKLYIVSDFDGASPLIQNKLLKVLEEPPRGVYFLLGAASLAPVLSTVRSRVKTLEIPPFSADEIYEALLRRGKDPLNLQAAESCGGILGAAQNMLSVGWYGYVHSAAKKICSVKTMEDAGAVALTYGDIKYKNELLAEMQRMYFAELREVVSSGDIHGATYTKPALVYAVENIGKALADVKFNVNFSALLYDFTVRVILENDKWKKLLV